MEWNYDITTCPLNEVVWMLSEEGSIVLPQHQYLGTVVNRTGYGYVKGECYWGDPEYFYRSRIIAWKRVDKELLYAFSQWCEKCAINYEYIIATPESIVDDFLTTIK